MSDKCKEEDASENQICVMGDLRTHMELQFAQRKLENWDFQMLDLCNADSDIPWSEASFAFSYQKLRFFTTFGISRLLAFEIFSTFAALISKLNTFKRPIGIDPN